MAIVFVTERQFVLAESVLDINVSENLDYNSRIATSGSRKKVSLLDLENLDNCPVIGYAINIEYIPVGWGAQGSGYGNSRNTQIVVKDKATALKLFKDLVDQYREQNPDELYLQKVMDRILAGEQKDDGSAAEVRSTGEA